MALYCRGIEHRCSTWIAVCSRPKGSSRQKMQRLHLSPSTSDQLRSSSVCPPFIPIPFIPFCLLYQGLTLGPRDSAACMWLLVAHTAGHLVLPAARVAAPRINCWLSTQQHHIQVSPF